MRIILVFIRCNLLEKFLIIFNALNITIVLHPGDSFASFIEQRKPLVFTRESNDPYVCNHGGILGHCVIKFSKALEMSNIPVGISGPNCDNVDDCNDDTFGDI